MRRRTSWGKEARMGERMKVRMEAVRTIEAVAEEAADLRVDTMSTREAVERLTSAIGKLKAKGYSLEKIAETLSANGIAITRQTLRSYLSLARGKQRGTRSGTPRRRAGRSGGGSIRSAREDHPANAGSTSGRAAVGRGRQVAARPPAIAGESRSGTDVSAGTGARSIMATGEGNAAVDASANAKSTLTRSGGLGTADAPAMAVRKGTFVPREDSEEI
jgi:hypothetical protein